MICPKCQSKNTYQDGYEMACMMCGKRWPIGAAASINTVKLSDKDGEMSVKKQCRNCGREMVIQADGLCGGCYGTVHRKFEKGTEEYNEALAEAKKRFTDPNYKIRSVEAQEPVLAPKTKPVIRKYRTTESEPAKLQKNIPENIHPKEKKTHRGVVQVLRERRHELMVEVDKITEAINTIQKYEAE